MQAVPQKSSERFSDERLRLLSLLRAAYQSRDDLELATFNEYQIRWAVETGLGPLLFQNTKADPEAANSPFWQLLKSADLTAQVLSGEQLNAMGEILEACEERGHVLTLLKGISICDQHYPTAHLRIMGDIDFLVENRDLPSVEATLLELGYRQQSERPLEFWEKHHHSMPFFHPERGIWVEVHRGLFPPESKLGAAKAFRPQNIKTQVMPSEFLGKKVTRLSAELQLVYIACHWADGLHVIGGMVPMLDIIYLLRNTKDKFSWEKVLDWLDDSSTCTRLYLILTYLYKYQLIGVPPEILHELFLRQRSFGTINLKILHAFMDRHLVDGRPFGRMLSLRNLHILCQTLLLPGPPIRNFMLVPKNLMPSFLGIRSEFY